MGVPELGPHHPCGWRPPGARMLRAKPFTPTSPCRPIPGRRARLRARGSGMRARDVGVHQLAERAEVVAVGDRAGNGAAGHWLACHQRAPEARMADRRDPVEGANRTSSHMDSTTLELPCAAPFRKYSMPRHSSATTVQRDCERSTSPSLSLLCALLLAGLGAGCERGGPPADAESTRETSAQPDTDIGRCAVAAAAACVVRARHTHSHAHGACRATDRPVCGRTAQRRLRHRHHLHWQGAAQGWRLRRVRCRLQQQERRAAGPGPGLR